ncbi:tRNA (N(6)-L-threonylcarbamoyladenosine(37)-C(2))-methylthiotransferase MtaB [Pedomonas mirosovicensis]|uniref:tRNA (N(6)-L-threonylcarbamoyladenosine(37)-C(2))- methylthiotransferase MtaB n=1 Tax=Pedomonas mirosovicensis TaxID=2908641 RepID=UPI00216A967A|nr:tRNA (N(6)-L-threonylcarbamoyladenosine(37)-C(2))-methylthiotransferase MtaB [Pedomonas mirosovicensis]
MTALQPHLHKARGAPDKGHHEHDHAETSAPETHVSGTGAKIVTFGCRLNTYESEAMRAHADASGDPNLVVVNTCAVTAEAVRQARQQIRKMKRENPEAKIIVTGCAAQIEPETFAGMGEVSRVLGNMEKFDPKNFRFDDGSNAYVRVNDIMSVKETAGHLIDGFAERARAFVEVQNGCDHRCTFCIIPYGRGNSRSVPAGLAVERIKRLVDKGYNEVVLTGVDITSYGGDLPGKPSLGNLVQRILKLVPDLPRLRLSSIDSIEADEALMEAIVGEARLMPHLHLSLQAGDDMILKRMKRRHLRDDAIRFCETVRAARPEVAFGADLIAGFPTETEEMFGNTLKLVDECGLTYLHVFPYSEREGTPAAKMPPVDKAVRKARAARLRALGEARLAAYLKGLTGTRAEVLVETVEAGEAAGHTPTFAPVRFTVEGESVVPGAIVTVEITGTATGTGGNHLQGRVA